MDRGKRVSRRGRAPSPPWHPEISVPATLARTLVEQQFPELRPARVESLGRGWDNAAFLVNQVWVFRFPQRAVAADLIETECRLLPRIAPRLPWPIPVPMKCGEPDTTYPWPFLGYRRLAGQTACRARLADAQRGALAAPLGEFLRALHGIDPSFAAGHGAPVDRLARLDVQTRAARLHERLDGLEVSAREARAVRRIIDETPYVDSTADGTLVHGDLYARHLLVDEAGRAAGVIDWGDVHRGHAAVDLSIVPAFLPPPSHGAFLEAYGPVDKRTWRLARFRAVQVAVMLLASGHDLGDEDLVREGRWSLRQLADD